jgi:hypothetical protein
LLGLTTEYTENTERNVGLTTEYTENTEREAPESFGSWLPSAVDRWRFVVRVA